MLLLGLSNRKRQRGRDGKGMWDAQCTRTFSSGTLALNLREMNIIVCRTVDHAKDTFDCGIHTVLCIKRSVVRYPVDLKWIIYILKKLRSYFTFRPTLFLFCVGKVQIS